MLSISNRAALCLTGLALAGCMQSMPTAESLTRPTVEAFTRLSSWTPWKPTPEQAPPPLVIADTPPPSPEAEPVMAAPEPAARPRPVRRSLETRRAPATATLATAKRVPVEVSPANVAAAPESASLLPARMSCQTTNQPGERVRMECKPVE
jgi:hypothetical protein